MPSPDPQERVPAPASPPLEQVIRDRIVRRLNRRVRDLAVSVERGVIRLEGKCATYYTKQLVQHAVLGVVEDETIVNGLTVTPSRLSRTPEHPPA